MRKKNTITRNNRINHSHMAQITIKSAVDIFRRREDD
jgi:hypothetical protein